MRKKSLLTMAASLALVAAVGVGSTLAYFTDKSEDVTNTFTVGKGYADQALKLEENEVERSGEDKTGEYYVPDKNVWTQENEYIKIMPGELLPKNPTVKLTANSVSSYVFVVVDGVDEALKALGNATLSGWNNKATFLKNQDETAKYDGVYYFETKEGTALEEAMFESIQVPTGATFEEEIPAMNFRAGAIQSQTFENAEEAYSAFVGSLDEDVNFEEFN